MSEEKLRILQMIQEGKISAAEGLELLRPSRNPRRRPVDRPRPGRRGSSAYAFTARRSPRSMSTSRSV
ncbi:MAG: SHOCT-like domain-containing protein [Bacillota bacterium]